MASAGEPKRLYDRQAALRKKPLRAGCVPGAKSALSSATSVYSGASPDWAEHQRLLQFLRSRG